MNILNYVIFFALAVAQGTAFIHEVENTRSPFWMSMSATTWIIVMAYLVISMCKDI